MSLFEKYADSIKSSDVSGKGSVANTVHDDNLHSILNGYSS